MKPIANGKTVGADRAGARRRHQLVPAGLRSRSRAVSSSPSISGAWGLTSWEKGKLQYKPGDVYQGVDYQMYRMGDTIGRI